MEYCKNKNTKKRTQKRAEGRNKVEKNGEQKPYSRMECVSLYYYVLLLYKRERPFWRALGKETIHTVGGGGTERAFAWRVRVYCVTWRPDLVRAAAKPMAVGDFGLPPHQAAFAAAADKSALSSIGGDDVDAAADHRQFTTVGTC